MSTTPVCDGNIIINSGVVDCDTGWQTALYVAPFDILQLDPAIGTLFFASGFMIFLIPWSAGVGVRVLLDMIRGKR